jgi:hypothetical protein
MKQRLAILCICVTASAGASASFKEYEVIINRKPFVKEPATAVTTPPTRKAPASASQYRLSAIYEGMDGSIRVGLVQKQGRKSLVLRQNESEEGVVLLSANLDSRTATIQESGRTYMLELTAVQAPAAKAEAPSRVQNAQVSSFVERRRKLLETINAKKESEPVEETPRLRGQELRQHLEDYQMDVIRNGMPPLPIPLTEEMDRQLVEEGVLVAVD